MEQGEKELCVAIDLMRIYQPLPVERTLEDNIARKAVDNNLPFDHAYDEFSNFVRSTYIHYSTKKLPLFMQPNAIFLTKVQNVRDFAEVNFSEQFCDKIDFLCRTELKKKGERMSWSGTGDTGRVFMIQDEGSSRMYALKCLNKSFTSDRNLAAWYILREAEIQEELARVGVTPAFKGFALLEGEHFQPLALVTEHVHAVKGAKQSMSLKGLLNEDWRRQTSSKQMVLTREQYKQLLLDITKQLQKMAKSDIVHADVKTKNIVLQLDESGTRLKPLMIDFGYSFHESDRARPRPMISTDNIITGVYRLKKQRQFAPELIFDPMDADRRTDVYGFGLILKNIGRMLWMPALVKLGKRMMNKNMYRRPSYEVITEAIQDAFQENNDGDSVSSPYGVPAVHRYNYKVGASERTAQHSVSSVTTVTNASQKSSLPLMHGNSGQQWHKRLNCGGNN